MDDEWLCAPTAIAPSALVIAAILLLGARARAAAGLLIARRLLCTLERRTHARRHRLGGVGVGVVGGLLPLERRAHTRRHRLGVRVAPLGDPPRESVFFFLLDDPPCEPFASDVYDDSIHSGAYTFPFEELEVRGLDELDSHLVTVLEEGSSERVSRKRLDRSRHAHEPREVTVRRVAEEHVLQPELALGERPRLVEPERLEPRERLHLIPGSVSGGGERRWETSVGWEEMGW